MKKLIYKLLRIILVLGVLGITAVSANPQTKMLASWYGDMFQGKLMASGKPFDKEAMIVAHRTLPLGTKLTLLNPRNKKIAHVIVADRGPYIGERELDVSEAVAKQLGFVYSGLAFLIVYYPQAPGPR